MEKELSLREVIDGAKYIVERGGQVTIRNSSPVVSRGIA